MEGILVSLGHVVEVEHDDDLDGDGNDHWHDDYTHSVVIDILSRYLALGFILILSAGNWEHTDHDHNTNDDLENRVDEELESHPFDEVGGGLWSVLLEPHEPLP